MVSFINNEYIVQTCLSPLAFDYKRLLWRIPHTEVKHVFREANSCIDALAAFAREHKLGILFCFLPFSLYFRMLLLLII